MLIDVTKGSVEEVREQPLTVWKDGPVTGALIEAEGKASVGRDMMGACGRQEIASMAAISALTFRAGASYRSASWF
jgi:hypothetical protein